MTETREFQDGEENANRSVRGESALKSDDPWGNAASDLANSVEWRFGVFPNFFRLAPETPEITEELWVFTQAAYLDNPLPSVSEECVNESANFTAIWLSTPTNLVRGFTRLSR